MSPVQANAQNIASLHLEPQVVVEKTKYEGKKALKTKVEVVVENKTVSASFTDFKKDNKWHRVIKTKNISNMAPTLFKLLAHATKLEQAKAKDAAQANALVKSDVQVDAAKITFSKPEKKRDGTLTLVATSTLLPGCEMKVKRDKKGLVDISIKKDNFKKIKKELQKDTTCEKAALFALIQERAIAKIAEFNKPAAK